MKAKAVAKKKPSKKKKPSNLDPTPIFQLFTTAFAAVTLTTLAVQYIRHGHHANSELWDDSIYISALITGLYLIVRVFMKTASAISSHILVVCALIGIGLGIGGIDHPGLSRIYWGGFGPYVLMIAVALTPWIWRILHFQNLNYRTKYLLRIITVMISAFSLVSLIQGSQSVIDTAASSYAINETLSVAAGHWPFVDSIPQYQTAFAFMIAPLRPFLTTNQLSELALTLLSAFSVIALALGVWLVRRCLPNYSTFIAIALVVPITCVTPFPGRSGLSGSIVAQLSALPVRIFPGVIILCALTWILGHSEMPIPKLKGGMIFIGLACGLNLWNSQDFGSALVVATFVGLLTLQMLSLLRPKSILPYWLIGLFFGFLVYPAVALAFRKTVNFSYFGYISRQFGTGFGAEPIQTPGPVLLILPLIIAISVCSIWILRQTKLVDGTVRHDLHFTGMVSLFFSFWTILGFCYYLNRSYASGQLQILLLPTAIAFGGLVGATLQMQKLEIRGSNPTLLFNRASFFKQNGFLLWPFSLVASLTLASVLLTPNPHTEMQRLLGKYPQTHWPISSVKISLNDAKVGLSFANYVELETGMKSAMIFNSPDDTFLSDETNRTVCTHLHTLHPDFLVLGDEGAQAFNRYPNKSLCGIYILQDIPGVRGGHLAKLVQ
jgi:hypothetical protein